MRRLVTAATSLCLLLAGATVPARAAGNSPPVAVDDPGPACSSQPPFDATYPVPEDWHDWALLALGCAPLINDSDADGDPLSVELVGQPAHGEAQVTPGITDDWLQYRPAKDWSTPRGDQPGGNWVSDTITYRAFDGQAYSNEAQYRLWVMPVNDPPTFTPGADLIETHAGDGPVSIQWATDVSPGPPNESAQHVSFEIMAPSADKFEDPPAIDPNGVLTFTPGPEPWLATVVVNAKDDGGLEDWNLPPSANYDQPDDTSDPVTFQIVIYPALPAPPVAVDDELTIPEDTPGHVSVIDNDTDINGDNLALTSVGVAGMGTAAKDDVEPWWVDYTPAPDENGTDEFTYTVSDGNGGADTGTVHVTITPVNDNPTAADDRFVVAQGASAVPLPVLDNDHDVDEDVLAVSAADGASHGTLDVTDGGLTYTPSPDYSGTDAFSYTVSDGTGGRANANVAIDVSADTDPPVVDHLADAIAAGGIRASTVPVRLSWRGADAGSGVTSYQLQRRQPNGHWATVQLPSPTSTSVVHSLAVGATARFRIRATDAIGNRSPFAEWSPIVVRRAQEASTAMTWTGRWREADDPRFSAGHSRHASAATRRATFAFNGDAVGWVSRPAPGGGHAQVRVDGLLVATVDLSAASTRYRRIVFRRALAAGGPHRIEIRPLGDGRVDIDAFIVLR